MKHVLSFFALAILCTSQTFSQQHWVKHPSTLTTHISAACFTDCSNGVVACKDSILRTTNAGASWTRQTEWPSKTLFFMFFVDVKIGFAVGDGIMRTTDGGLTWHDQDCGTSAGLTGVSFIDANTGIAVGMRGTILRTTDGGDHWNLQREVNWDAFLKGGRPPDWYVAVSMADANSITIVGYFGKILHSSNGGVDWVTQSDGPFDEVFQGVCFTDCNNGTVVGQAGTILHTTNGGADWRKIKNPVWGPLNKVSFYDANNGLIVGREGTILRTMDGGATWTVEKSGTKSDLQNVFTFAPNKAVALGWDGVIFTTP